MLAEPVTPARDPISLFAQLDAERPALLVEVATRLDGWRIPGSDVATWLAGVPVLLIAECLRGPRAVVARRLFRLVGQARASGGHGGLIDFDTADLSNVPRGPYADATLQAWASLQLVRINLDIGRPADAACELRGFLQEIGRMPPALAARFLSMVERLTDLVEAANLGRAAPAQTVAP